MIEMQLTRRIDRLEELVMLLMAVVAGTATEDMAAEMATHAREIMNTRPDIFRSAPK